MAEFLLRGLEKVQGEWSLILTGQNPESSSWQALLKPFRLVRQVVAPVKPTLQTV